MKNKRTIPGPSGASTASEPNIRAQAAHIIEATRAMWRRDALTEHSMVAHSARPQRDVLRRQLFDNLDTALAVAELMAHLFGYERDGRALELQPVRPASPRQRLGAMTMARARSAALAGNDDFYGAGARRQRSSSVTRRGAHSWKK